MKSVKKHGFESLEVGSQLWRHENKAAIEAYKQLVEEHGTLGDDLRIF